MASIQNLVAKYNGTVFGITGADQGQCTAVPHAWQTMLGLPIVYGNAKDTYDNAPDDLYDKTLNVPNDLSNYPQPGAIMVWDDKWGDGYGHTAVVVSADGNTAHVLEQNDGDNGITHIGEHNYLDVIGWFTPKILIQQSNVEAPMNAQQETQAYEIVLNREPELTVPTGRTGFEFIQAAQAELSRQRQNTANILTAMQNQVDTVNEQNSNLSKQITADQTKIQDLTKQVASQATTIQELNAKPTDVAPTQRFFATPMGKLILQGIGLVSGYIAPYVTSLPLPPDVSALIGTILGHFISNQSAK